MEALPSTSKENAGNNESSVEDTTQGGVFKCYICNLEENYEYKGTEPPFARHLVMAEECYMMEDPFSLPGNGEFLTLGADCSECGNQVCKGIECSFFYCKTYCVKCVKTNVHKFPEAVQTKVNKLCVKL